MRTVLQRIGRLAALLLPLGLAACQTLIKTEPCGPDGCASVPPIHEPKVVTNPTMHAAACDLDHLEKHIDWYGSVVAKTPDVWGQARLTRYREEFEREMSVDKNPFALELQGALARSDQAFFAHATALSLAARPRPPVIGRVTEIVPQTRDVTVVTNTSSERKADGVTTKQDVTDKATFGQPKAEEGPIKLPTAVSPKDLLSDPDKAILREELLKDRRIGYGELKTAGIGLEPSLVVAQKKRHLDFLNQIRRENEGDDTADSPGYSLNLIRVPVSVLPGKRTDVGHGAEITMTLTPVLGDDLLPATFRNLVANDLLHQLGFPLTQVLGTKGITTILTPDSKLVIIALPAFHKLNELRRTGTEEAIQVFLLDLTPRELDGLKQIAKLLDSKDATELLALLEKAEPDIVMVSSDPRMPMPGTPERKKFLSERTITFKAEITSYKDTGDPQKNPGRDPNAPSQRVEQRAKEFALKLPIPPMSYSPGLVNKTGFPTSQLLDVYGLSDCFQIAFAAHTALQESIKRQNYAHLPDIQGFLQQEIVGAYRFLAEPGCQHLWHLFCTRDMVTAVRTRNLDVLQAQRATFRTEVKKITGDSKKPFNEPGEYSTTAALAWCILVDSALLNDRLVRDMRETATSKGYAPPPADYWPQYYMPDPPPEARCAFNAYVTLRWPIRVFALDPYTQDQNIADQFSSRREMQLALSIAFTNGFIGANTLTKYTRRLEAEYETIALNRTQVGFSHGENVFGWRFYPRFQTPDTESNLTVFVRDQLIGGPSRNALLRQRRLEPGPRECVAVVMMPSFVPYATLDTTSNWFGLANPKHKVLDHTQALKLSHTVHTLKNAGCGVQDANCYRDGELGRLLRRAEQLEARLPSQTLTVPVPVLNTLGGFEMFAHGVTDLAPELYGWYGAPGVSDTDDSTTLFLVGDHFSPLNTKVIVGNRAIIADNQRMLSRQVVQVTVPKGTLLVSKDGKPHVSAHIATPYGVTRELLIPVVKPGTVAEAPKPPPAAPTEGYTFGAADITLPYCKKGAGKGEYHLGIVPLPKTAAIKLNWADALGTAPVQVKDVTFTFTYKNCPFEIAVPTSIVANGGSYALTNEHLTPVLTELFKRLNAFAPFTDETDPLATGLKVTATVTPIDEGRAVVPAKVTGELTFKFACTICDDKALVPGRLPLMPEPKKVTETAEPTSAPLPASPAPAPSLPTPLPPAPAALPKP